MGMAGARASLGLLVSPVTWGTGVGSISLENRSVELALAQGRSIAWVCGGWPGAEGGWEPGSVKPCMESSCVGTGLALQ